jgi:acetolactate synthase regulatory subunit
MLENTKKTYQLDVAAKDKPDNNLKWAFTTDYRGVEMVQMTFTHVIKTVIWHSKGDYLATMAYNI